MRSESNLYRQINNRKLQAILKPLQGGCIGLYHYQHDTKIIQAIDQNTGYSILQKFQYVHTFKIPANEIDAIPNTIVY